VKTRNLVLTALFIALSFVGSNVKISGTIAFDSLPAFLGALLLGPVFGAFIGFLGHLFSALLTGFPFGLPTHIVIAFGMAVTMLGFGHSYRLLKGKLPLIIVLIITGIVGVILNGPFSLALCAPLIGPATAIAMAPVLILGSAANIVIAILLFKGYEYGMQRRKG